jgi:hypothetical protein
LSPFSFPSLLPHLRSTYRTPFSASIQGIRGECRVRWPVSTSGLGQRWRVRLRRWEVRTLQLLPPPPHMPLRLLHHISSSFISHILYLNIRAVMNLPLAHAQTPAFSAPTSATKARSSLYRGSTVGSTRVRSDIDKCDI